MNSTELGFIFSDQLRESSKKLKPEFVFKRLKVFRILLFFFFIAFTLRLSFLQIVEGDRNRALSDENRILARRIQAPRGVIMDRNGMVIVQNIPIYKVEADCPQDEADYCIEYRQIDREEAIRMEAAGRAREITTFVGRSYVYGPQIAHVTGFVGELDRDELSVNPDYELGDLIGKTGIEYMYEELLHGRNGAELVEVDATSSVVREVAKREPVSGEDLRLTVDHRLQTKAYELLGDSLGALVALDPENGEVLTLVSTSSFDPNNVAVSLDRPDQPFFNRAITGLYPPGSVFKVVTATAGLEEGKIDAETQIEDTGEIRIGSYRYGNWYFSQYGRKEGLLNIVRAIKRSNDIFFYRVGELVGATTLSEWAKAFGFGRESGIDLPREAQGLVPSPLWKEREKGERWFLGNTYHFAIGQSDLEVTPLQVAQMTGVAAEDGNLCRPHILLDREEEDELCQGIELEAETLRLVKEGMVEACLSGGTAFPFFNFGIKEGGQLKRIEVGCKTGTAEYGNPEGRTHAWFTVYAPAQDPEIVVTVLLEGAGEGSYQAAPVAKEFLEYYFGEIADSR